MSSTELAAAAHLPRPSHLHAVQVMCTLAGGLARLTHLEHLDVNFTPWEMKTEPCLAHSILQSMTGLTCLSIGQTIYASPAASLLLCLTQLESLHVIVYFDYAIGVRQVSSALARLASLTSLTIQLDALQPSVSDEACFNCVADAITNLHSLEQLSLAVLPRVDMPWQRRALPDALTTLSKLKGLSLGMSGDVGPIIDLLPSMPCCSLLTKLLVKTRDLKAGDAWMRLRNAVSGMHELLELYALSSPPCAANSDHTRVHTLSTQHVSPALGKLTCLVLDMEWAHECSENVSGFLSVLGTPSILKTLEISFNDSVDNTEANKQLMNVLPCAVSLRQLHLKRSQITGDGTQMLALCCANTTQLTRLHLHDAFTDRTCDHLQELYTAFGHLQNIQSLSMLAASQEEDHQRIPEAAAEALHDAIKGMQGLRVLNLEGWQFPNESLKALAPGFPCCRNLTRLRLSRCFISGADVRHLLPALEATTWLQKLDVSYNCISDSAMAKLIGMVSSSSFVSCCVCFCEYLCAYRTTCTTQRPPPVKFVVLVVNGIHARIQLHVRSGCE